MRKRILSTLLILCIVLSLMPSQALAVEVTFGDSEPTLPLEAGDELEYFEDDQLINNLPDKPYKSAEVPAASDSTLYASSDWVTYPATGGDLYFDPTTGAIADCSTNVTSVDIPSSIDGVAVTNIDKQAFLNCHNLNNVTIPESVTNIGPAAFAYCESLTSVTIPDSVISIGEGAFSNCKSLTSIVIPNGVASIETNMFSSCSSLTSVTIPNSVTSIGTYAFEGCSGLTNVAIPGGVISIGKYAFWNCSSLSEIIIPNSVTSVGIGVFCGCSSLKSVRISNSITCIDQHVFDKCSSLTSVTIPNSVTGIGYCAFDGCTKLTSVTIPTSVTGIDPFAFGDCNSLTDVYYGGQKAQWNAIQIRENNDQLSFASIHFNSTGPERNGTCGDNLTWSLKNGTLTISGTGEMKNYWTPLGSITGDGSTDVVPWYEYGNEIENIVITGGVTSIGDRAFYGCNVVKVTIPDSVVSIGYGAFELCTSLTDVYYGGSKTDWGNISISNTDYCNESLLSATIHYTSTGPDDMATQIPCEQIVDALRVGETKELPYCFFDEDIENMVDTSAESITENDISIFLEDKTILQIEKSEYNRDDYGYLYAIYTVKALHIGTTTVTVYVGNTPIKKYEIQVEIDRWRFLNNNDQNLGQWPHAGGYYISNEDYSRLVQNLDSVEKQKISFENNSQWTLTSRYNKESALRPLFVKWNGSCDGMSRWACLVGANILSPKLVSQQTLYEATDLSLKIQSAINYYHHQQWLSSWKEAENQFMSDSQEKQLEQLKASAIIAQNGGTPIYIAFQWCNAFKSNGQCDTSSIGAHAVVGYGLEDGLWPMNVNGQNFEFTHRVLIYDCEKISNVSSVFDYNLYFNDFGIWYIPCYNLISTSNDISGINNNAKFQLVTNDTALINQIDYATGRVNSKPKAFLPMLSVPAHTAYTVKNGDDIYKICGLSVVESTNGEKLNIILDSNATAEGKGATYEATVILPNIDSEYTVTTDENSASFCLDYGNYLESATLNTSGSISFRPDGVLSMQSNDLADYTLSITANNGYTSLPWYTIAATGTKATEVSAELSSDGVILCSDNLVGVAVYGVSDAETKELVFSTSANSVLITDKSNELVIMTDTDGDGTYETPITTKTVYTITFDACNGTVTPITATTDAVGKLSILPTPTRVNYSFNGWYTAPNSGNKITINTVFNSDTTVYAQWIYTGSSAPSTPSTPNNPGGWFPGSNNHPITTYSVSVPSVTGGKVSINPTSAFSGATVAITATPDAGYELISLTVTGKGGENIDLTSKGSNLYSFTMPNGEVTINAKFDLIWVNPFSDVAEGAWYYDAVKFANQNGLMNGVGNSLFAPATHLSRAMLAEILYNKEGRPPVTVGSTFADIQPGAWYTDAVAWVSEKGIANGYGSGLFGPGDDITREQLAVMLYRYAGSPVPPNLLLDFSDAYKVSNWAQDAMRWAVDQGILNGKGNGILDPTGKATRAETAQMLKNYFEQ